MPTGPSNVPFRGPSGYGVMPPFDPGGTLSAPGRKSPPNALHLEVACSNEFRITDNLSWLKRCRLRLKLLQRKRLERRRCFSIATAFHSSLGRVLIKREMSAFEG